MRAIVQHVYGGPEVLRLDDIEVPEPGNGQVRVRVLAAALDAGVWHITTGTPPVARLGLGLTRPRGRVSGQELAGVVDAVGPGVTRWSVGDRVFGQGSGAFAEYAVAREDRLAALPDGVAPEAAATLAVSASTALIAVRAGRVAAGQRVLVIGAGGGVGSFAVQIAVALGASVTGVASGGKEDLVRKLGAERFLDYTAEPLTAAGQHDVVIDTAGNRPLGELRPVLVRSGTAVLVGSGVATAGWLAGMDRAMASGLVSLFVPQRLVAVMGVTRSADLAELAAMVVDGSIAPAIGRVGGLEEVPDAVAELGRGHMTGKAVFLP
ncbi:NAD(P)-dependent alcohol dehydrogenase [Antribacter gilvus]|uniref:NAD(P)-dependent alcohol dehydrogenase n=1 Tax=Antribacter gilvus TaxID=2304675 RepID=UPI000F794A16|nr:NAD(P)-dependent alcohol dehydrogenase [Antribacter gilvus]